MNKGWEVRKKSTRQLLRLIPACPYHMCTYSDYCTNKCNFAAPVFQSVPLVRNQCVNSSAKVCIVLSSILYWLRCFLFKELVVLMSYSIVNILDIVRFPLIWTLKIISRVWIISQSERAGWCDSCSGKQICYIFMAVKFWTKEKFKQVYLKTNTLIFISKQTGLQQPKHDKYIYWSFITSLLVHFHAFQK